MKTSQDHDISPLPGPSADAAARALRDAGAAGTRAQLRTRVMPAWFGPVFLAASMVNAGFKAWSADRTGGPVLISLFVSVAYLVFVVVLIRAVGWRGAVRSGVTGRVRFGWSRSRRAAAVADLLMLVAVALVTWGVCALTGCGEAATGLWVSGVYGLAFWGLVLRRNAAIRRELAELSRER